MYNTYVTLCMYSHHMCGIIFFISDHAVSWTTYVLVYVCAYYLCSHCACVISDVTWLFASDLVYAPGCFVRCDKHKSELCIVQCMQWKHVKSSKTSKTYVNVYSTKSVLILYILWCMKCMLEQKHIIGRTNAHQLTLWQGVDTPRHCITVSQRIYFYSARVSSVWVQPPNGVVTSSRRQNMTWGHTTTSPCDSVGERGSFRRWPLKRNGVFPRSDCHNSGCKDICAHVMKEWLSVVHALVGAQLYILLTRSRQHWHGGQRQRTERLQV